MLSCSVPTSSSIFASQRSQHKKTSMVSLPSKETSNLFSVSKSKIFKFFGIGLMLSQQVFAISPRQMTSKCLEGENSLSFPNPFGEEKSPLLEVKIYPASIPQEVSLSLLENQQSCFSYEIHGSDMTEKSGLFCDDLNVEGGVTLGQVKIPYSVSFQRQRSCNFIKISVDLSDLQEKLKQIVDKIPPETKKAFSGLTQIVEHPDFQAFKKAVDSVRQVMKEAIQMDRELRGTRSFASMDDAAEFMKKMNTKLEALKKVSENTIHNLNKLNDKDMDDLANTLKKVVDNLQVNPKKSYKIQNGKEL